MHVPLPLTLLLVAVFATPAGAADDDIVWYECDDGDKAWHQPQPCPTHVSRTRLQPFSGQTSEGTPVQGQVYQQVDVPVRQYVLTERELCANRSRPARDADEVYQRNKRC